MADVIGSEQTHAATCVQCGREFESAGTLREALAATPEQRVAARAARDAQDAENGGPRGVCSFRCLVRRLLSSPVKS